MIRSQTGNRLHYPRGAIATPDEVAKTTWETPWSIKPSQIINRLCKSGPDKCKSCRMCAFGRYYVDNRLDEILPAKKPSW